MDSFLNAVIRVCGQNIVNEIQAENITPKQAHRIVCEILASCRHLWELPRIPELISMILGHLTLREREPLRRVCSSWNLHISDLPHGDMIPRLAHPETLIHLGVRYGIARYLPYCRSQEEFDTLLLRVVGSTQEEQDRFVRSKKDPNINITDFRADRFVTLENLHLVYMVAVRNVNLYRWAIWLPDISVLEKVSPPWTMDALHCAWAITGTDIGDRLPVRTIHYIHRNGHLQTILDEIIDEWRNDDYGHDRDPDSHPLDIIGNTSWPLLVYLAHFYLPDTLSPEEYIHILQNHDAIEDFGWSYDPIMERSIKLLEPLQATCRSGPYPTRDVDHVEEICRLYL